MLTLYDNAFSPFARKVRMVLEHKGLAFDVVDGLKMSNQAELARVNPRREVPVLVDGDVSVVGSSHIVAYLEDAYPQRPVLPGEPRVRARARHWERISDSLLDAILLNVSIWTWAERADSRPAGMLEKARDDIGVLYAALERELADSAGGFVCGEFSLADIALFPHLRSVRALGLPIDDAAFPKLSGWLARMDEVPVARADTRRLRAWFAVRDKSEYERRRIFWRGDRLEWLLASGFHEWLMQEIREGRVSWPQPGA